MIQALALRMAALYALRGATPAGNRVYDSAISTIDELIGADPSPVIVLVTDEEVAEIEVLDVLAGTRKIALVIEVVIASAVTLPDDEGEAVVVAPTDEKLEISLAVTVRSLMRALFGRASAWGNIFADLAHNVKKITLRRGADAPKDGMKFAARQIVIELEPYAEPPFGRPVDPATALGRFMAAITASAPSIAGVIKGAIESQAVPNWDEMRGSLGMSAETAWGIGVHPIDGSFRNDGTPAPLSEIRFDDPVRVVNQQMVDDNVPEAEQ